MDTQLKNTMEELVNKTLKAGASSCDVILSKGESFSISAQNNDIDKYKVSGAQVIGVRALFDSKVGLAYSESLDPEALEFAAKAAVENAKNSEENPYETLQEGSGDFIYPSQYEKDNASTEDKIKFCLELESEVKKRDSRVSAVPYNGLSESNSNSYYFNSSGLFSFESEYYYSCYTSALIHEGTKNSMHYHGVMGRKLADLNARECIEESLLHASKWLDAEPLKTGEYDVVFTTDAFEEIFGCFSNIFSGKAAMEKTNPFADRLNQQVVSSLLTIKDIPHYKDAFFTSNIDSEGVVHKDLTLIENGELKSFYHNSATANYFKTNSTGHAARGARTALGVRGTTKVISEGTVKSSDLLAGEYFEVHSLQGLHSGANSISGEFSFAASGYLCRDGKRVTPIKGVTVSGNFHKMLLDLKMIGDTIQATTDKMFFAPLLRFEKMSIGGV